MKPELPTPETAMDAVAAKCSATTVEKGNLLLISLLLSSPHPREPPRILLLDHQHASNAVYGCRVEPRIGKMH